MAAIARWSGRSSALVVLGALLLVVSAGCGDDDMPARQHVDGGGAGAGKSAGGGGGSSGRDGGQIAGRSGGAGTIDEPSCVDIASEASGNMANSACVGCLCEMKSDE